MPTTVTKKIGATNSPLTMDYTTLASWEAALPANLVTGDTLQEGAVYDQGEFTSSSTLLTIAGQTTDATRYVHLRGATAAETGGQGASFKDKTAVRTTALYYNASNGCAINSSSGAYVNCIVISTANTRITGMQIKAGAYCIDLSGVGSAQISNCICLTVTANKICIDAKGGSSTFLNCLIIGPTVGGGVIQLGRSGGTGCSVIGCTVIQTGAATNANIGADNYGTHVIKDTCGFGSGTFVSTTSSSASSSYNATDKASGFGSNNQTSLTFASQFQSSTNDFRAVSTGSLDLNGVADAKNIPNDISETSRHASTPTIGCWEVVATAAASGAFANQVMLPNNRVGPMALRQQFRGRNIWDTKLTPALSSGVIGIVGGGVGSDGYVITG